MAIRRQFGPNPILRPGALEEAQHELALAAVEFGDHLLRAQVLDAEPIGVGHEQFDLVQAKAIERAGGQEPLVQKPLGVQALVQGREAHANPLRDRGQASRRGGGLGFGPRGFRFGALLHDLRHARELLGAAAHLGLEPPDLRGHASQGIAGGLRLLRLVGRDGVGLPRFDLKPAGNLRQALGLEHQPDGRHGEDRGENGY